MYFLFKLGIVPTNKIKFLISFYLLNQRPIFAIFLIDYSGETVGNS